MTLRFTRSSLILILAAIPMSQFSCSGEERNFVPTAGTAGNGGTTADAASGGTAGSAGASTGGTAGASGGTPVDGGTPCQTADECDDGEVCNGLETCDAGFCVAGNVAPDGTECSPDYGDGGAPDGGTGEFVCAAGACALKCESDLDCEDNDVCTGKEICHPTSKTCLHGTPLSCEDNDVCTTNSCDAISGCYFPLIDNDGDGHAASSLGACGDDCDDNDDTIYAGAAEACDNKDNNCNGQTDETAPSWYPDCDGDGFAATGAPGVQQCQAPAAPHANCNGNGGWTLTAPASGTTDCWDKDAKAHPMTSTQNNSAWQTVPMSGSPPVSIDYDYNCDGTEELQAAGYANVGTSSSCTYATGSSCYAVGGFGGIGGLSGIDVPNAGGFGGTGGIGFISCCKGTDGWVGAAPTTCGASASYTTCDFKTTTSCGRTTTSKKRACR